MLLRILFTAHTQYRLPGADLKIRAGVSLRKLRTILALVCLMQGSAVFGQLPVAKLHGLGTWVPYPQGGGTYLLDTSTVLLNANCTESSTPLSNDTLAWNENHPGFFVQNGLYYWGTWAIINRWKEIFPNFTFTPTPDFDASLNKNWLWRVTCGTSGGGGGGNTAKPNLTCTQPGGWADKMVISKVQGTSTNGSGFMNTDTLYVDIAALNNGNAVANGGWKVKYFVDEVLVATRAVASALNPTNYYTYTDVAIGPLVPGVHVIKVVLDADNNVSESNEGDNTCQKAITVGGGAVAASTNLTCYQLTGWSDKLVISKVRGTSTDSTGLMNTDILYVDITPHNSGSATITTPWRIKYYVDDEHVATWSIDTTLNPNTIFGNIVDKSIGYLTAGTHTVKVVLDADDAIAESNESDNICQRTITVGGSNGPNLTFKLPTGWPDRLMVSTMPDSFTDNASSLLNTQKLYLRAAPLNNGTSAVTASWKYRFFVDGVQVPGWTITQDMGAHQFFSNLYKEIGPLTAGTHILKVTVDVDNEIAETIESDNSYERTITLTGVPGLPDLTDAGTYYDVSQAMIEIGGTLGLHHNIKNQGTGASTDCIVNYYLSTNSTISGSDTYIGRTAVPFSALPAGAADRVDASLTIPGGVIFGTYYVGWILDGDQVVSESNEVNNTGVFPSQVTVGVVKPVVAVDVSPASVNEGGSTTMRYTFTRTGSTAAALMVNFSISGTAWYFADYSPSGAASFDGSSGAVIIGVGSASTFIDVSAFTDDASESNETLTFTLSLNSAYTLGSALAATGTIVDVVPSAAPVITQQPASQTLTPGESATFFVIATGNPAPTYQWQFRANTEAVWQDVATTDTGSITLIDGRAGHYRVIVSNGVNPVAFSQTATLTVTNPPATIDLRDEGTQFHSLSPTSGYAGQAVTVRGDIRNGGNTASSAFAVRVYASADTAITAADTLLTTVNMTSGIAAQSKAALNASVTIPSGLSASAWYIGWIIDSGGAVTETNESNNTVLMTTQLTVTSSPPTISVSATTAQVIEGTSNGVFTVSRTGGNSSVPTPVSFTVSGTAQSGADFAALSGTVTIPAGASTTTVPLSPINDTVAEPDETVILTISPSGSYQLGTARTATVTIRDDDAPPVITLVTPAATDVAIPAGVGLIVTATASRATTAGTVQTPVSWSVTGPAAAPLESIAPGTAGIRFAQNGIYTVTTSATHGATTVTRPVTVRVGVMALAGTQVGTTTAAGSVSVAGGSYTVTGAGTGVSTATTTGTSDGFYFVAAPKTGNFDIRCRVASLSNPGGSNSCRFGLMARESLATGAKYAFNHYRGNGLHSWQYRFSDDSLPDHDTENTNWSPSRWLRLVRTGDGFTAYYSDNGTTWNQRGSTQTIALGSAPFVGLAVTSAVPDTAATVVFDSLNFTLASNAGPFVSAGPDLAGGGPFNLDGTITDDGLPVPTPPGAFWAVASGPAAAVFGNAASFDTSASFASPGTYVLRLTGSDSVVTTFDTATITVNNFTGLDGQPDAAGYLLLNAAGGIKLYAAVRGNRLYAATESPGANDTGTYDTHVLVSNVLLPSATISKYWAKSGLMAVTTDKPLLGGESINDYVGWVNAGTSAAAAKSSTLSGVMEGTFDLTEAFGSLPPVLYFSAAAHATADGGALLRQAPAGNGNQNLEPGEFLAVPLAALMDQNFDGVLDRLDPRSGFLVTAARTAPGTMQINWPVIPGMRYQVQSSPDLNSWQSLGSLVTAVSGDNIRTVTDASAIGPKRFYRIRQVP